MLNIKASSATALYTKMCKAIIKAPIVTTRGLTTRETIGFRAELTKPLNRLVCNPDRSMDRRYLVGELSYFLDGRKDLKSIAFYSKFWNKISDDGMTVNSAYGHRLFWTKNSTGVNQLSYIVETLVDDTMTRKAVLSIYNIEDARKSNDNPCTMFLQFFIRNNKLECHTFMRSNDIWLGFPYDIAFFTLVQEIVYNLLKQYKPTLKLGSYFHNVTSLHAYQDNWQRINACAAELTPAVEELTPPLNKFDIFNWFNDLLTFEKSYRGVVMYKKSCIVTPFQDWCKKQLIDNERV